MKHLVAAILYVLAITAGALAVGLSTVTATHALTIKQALSQCPDVPAARACRAVAAAFLAERIAGPKTDAQIVNLVRALADAAERPNVSLRVCRNTADGMKVLARGMTNGKQARQVIGLANDLCDAKSAGVPRLGPPASIAGGIVIKKPKGDLAPDVAADDTADDTLGDTTCHRGCP